MKRLKDVQQFLNSIPNINCGGCGISALAMYRWLKKNDRLKDEKAKFIFCYKSYNEDKFLNNEEVLKKGEGNIKAPTHVVIHFKKRYIDSEGTVDIREYKHRQHIEDEDFMVKTNNSSGWNEMFNRCHLENIQGFLGIDMSDILTRV
jgi:hypothetical protein